YSGRVGRSAGAKSLDEVMVALAVRTHIRHRETNYDSLLAKGWHRTKVTLPQRGVHCLEIEKLRIETASNPGEKLFVPFVFLIPNCFEKSLVTPYSAAVFRRVPGLRRGARSLVLCGVTRFQVRILEGPDPFLPQIYAD